MNDLEYKMNISLSRIKEDGDATLGRLSYTSPGGIVRVLWTVEDQKQLRGKVSGETRIPAGTYDIKLRRQGGMVKRYDKRFAPFHDGMLHLQDVPDFKYVYIHVGNDDDDTEGCILVGLFRVSDKLAISSSAIAYARLYKECYNYAYAGKLTITIEDNFSRL